MSNEPALRLGDRGDRVRQLQGALSKAGFGCRADGIFGRGTQRAVKVAQKAHGLTPDGIAGPLTRKALSPRAGSAKSGGGPGLTPRGAAFIGHFEGFSGKLYNDPVGHCTVGFGHLVHRGPMNGSEPADFKRGITRERGLELLREDAEQAADAIERLVKVDLAPYQRDALISFTFNLGTGAFASSTLLTLLNQGNYDSVPEQLNRWTKASGRVLPGLVRRRHAEGALFSKGTYVT
jgi:GH24 family phage-related lysozyme (muramidase)